MALANDGGTGGPHRLVRRAWEEAERLAALSSYAILDTPREAAFDDIARLAAAVFEAPIAVVNLIADGRQWFKAEVGIGADELPLDVSLCAHAILEQHLLVVPDTRADPRFACNPLVHGDPGVGFYAGAVLETPDGLPLGTVCVLDTAPRRGGISERQRLTLEVLAGQVMTQLELRRALAQRNDHALHVAGAALAESENRFRAMADDAPVMIWVTDPSGYCTYLNRRWYDFTGQTVAQAQGYGWLDVTHPEDKPRAERAFVDANTAQRQFGVEYRLRGADGRYRWHFDAASPRFDSDGGFLGYVGSVIDIDERRRANERLRQSEEQLRLATDAAEIGLWDLDPTSDTLYWPPRVKAMFGISADAAISMADFYAGLHHDDAAATADAFAATVDPARRDLYDVEYRTIGKEDGLVRWVAAKGRGLFDDNGVCIRVIGTALDITSRKQIEAELRDLNETLEQRVAGEVAAHAETEEALRQAQKMEAVGQLTGGIAHDFNNLLTGVIGSLDLMQRKIAGGRVAEIDRHVTAAITSANRAAALTHRLLAFSRRQPLDPRAVDANRMVTSMEDLLRRTLGESVQLEMVTDDGLWTTLCDPHQLESAILNLAINARDAMPDGGRLTIETCNAHLDDAYIAATREVRPGHYVCICVSDTGTGMTRDTIERAFEPFFTTKPIGQGTGLGLSMIYGFARQSDGYARIYSEVGQGTTIKLYLPRHDGDASEQAAAAAPTREEQASRHGEIVLVVEDETAVRDLILEVLGDLGYRTLQAADGPSALAILLGDQAIDLLVTDVGLPGLNGRQLADAARGRRPELKILFMTGYAENAAINGGFLDPGMALLTKPFAVDTLAQRVRAMLV